MVPKKNTTATKAPALNDSRFHNNNTSQSIKVSDDTGAEESNLLKAVTAMQFKTGDHY